MVLIFCAILGEAAGTCCVDVEPDATGFGLARAIEAVSPDITCPARDFRVYVAKVGGVWLDGPRARAVELDEQGFPRGFEAIGLAVRLSGALDLGEDLYPGGIHVLVAAPPYREKMKIFCAVLDKTVGICGVALFPNATGADLKQAIKDVNPDITCPITSIRVFLAKTGDKWLNSPACRALELDDQRLPRGFHEIDQSEQLSDARYFGEAFEQVEGDIHILVTIPPSKYVTLKPKALLLVELLLAHQLTQAPTTPTHDNQKFTDSVSEYYDCNRPNHRVRCMLLDVALPPSLVVASHLFRRSNKNLSGTMEIPDIDDARNGLLLFMPLKYAFDRHQISFIGDDKGELRLKLFDPSIRDTRLVDLKDRDGKRVLSIELLRVLRKSTRQFDVGTTFGNVNGRALVFTGSKRLFFHILNSQARVARAVALKNKWIDPSCNFEDFWTDVSLKHHMPLFHQSIMSTDEEC